MASFWQQLVGSKPKVPTLDKLDLGTEAGKAIAANQQNLPAAETLTSEANQFSRDEITKMLNQIVPGFSGMQGDISKNIEAELTGQIPDDVRDAIARSDAATSLTGGTGGTEFSRNLVARDLGLTSLQLTRSGLSSAESWTKTMASLYEPSQLNLSSMFISPMQQYQTENEQNMQQFQRQWMQNQIDAMPAPWAEDLKQFVYRAMAAYSGTSVSPNPYSTPGSFGGGLGGGGGGGMSFVDTGMSAGDMGFGDIGAGNAAAADMGGGVGAGVALGGF